MGKTKILTVDENDQVTGAALRKDAIANNQAHRIVRVLVFNPQGDMYLQKRAATMEWGGLWDQSVGGHVDEGETYEQAAIRETEEELGLKNVELKPVTTYYHEVKNPDGDVLKRFNRLYTVVTDQEPNVDPGEVAEGRWVPMSELTAWIERSPEEFTQPGGIVEALGKYQERNNA